MLICVFPTCLGVESLSKPGLSWGRPKAREQGFGTGSLFRKGIPGNRSGRMSKGRLTKGRKESQPKSELLSQLPRWPLVLSLAGDSGEQSKCSSTWATEEGSQLPWPAGQGCSRVKPRYSSRFVFVPERRSRLPATSSSGEGRDPGAVRLGRQATPAVASSCTHQKSGLRGCETSTCPHTSSSLLASALFCKKALFPLSPKL